MVDYCANPKCLKPLHYLREGTVYLFEIAAPSGEGEIQTTHRLEHYWLCGDCSAAYRLERTANKEILLTARSPLRCVTRPAVSIVPKMTVGSESA